MSYDDEVRAELQRASDEAWGETKTEVAPYAEVLAMAIPPLTLKTENGRFVKVEESCGDPGEGWYRIVPEPEP